MSKPLSKETVAALEAGPHIVWLVRQNDALEWVCGSRERARQRVAEEIVRLKQYNRDEVWVPLVGDDGHHDRWHNGGSRTIWIEPREVDES